MCVDRRYFENANTLYVNDMFVLTLSHQFKTLQLLVRKYLNKDALCTKNTRYRILREIHTAKILAQLDIMEHHKRVGHYICRRWLTCGVVLKMSRKGD